MTQGKTTPELDPLVAPLVDSDVLVAYRAPGPLKRTTAGTVLAYVQAIFAASGGSALLGFLQAGTGATTVTAQAKLRQAPVQPNSGEFGAFTNATVTTATLLKAFTAAMADGRAVELSGNYTINGTITPETAIDGSELHIILRDDVTITVDAASTAFNRVFYAETTTAKSHSITGGGTLTINCNDKAAAGIWLRHNEAATGGTVVINAPVHIKNVYAVTAYSVASGIFLVGRFERVVMRSPTVEDVSRQLAGGESSGISISGFDGEVELYTPVVRRIKIGGGTTDADGIKCFGRGAGFTKREGSVRVYDAVFEDCQGRSYKDQCGDTVLYRPFVRRRAIDGNSSTVAISDSVEFDFQRGGGLVLNPHAEYYKSATAVSPLGASHSVAAFQQLATDAEMYGAIRNGTIISDVDIVRYVLSAQTGGAASTTEVDGLTLIPRSGFTTTMIGRGVLEFDASQVAGKSAETILSVKNVSGPITFPCIAYTGYTAGTNLTAKLTVKVDKCSTSLAIAGNQTRAISNIAGDEILSFKAFEIGDNPGFRMYYSGWVFSVRSLRAGTKLVLDLTSGTVTNAPPWGSSGVGYIECMGISLIGSLTQDTICRAYLNNASTAGSAWVTQTGGATWGVLN
jgi:hypothetical protein